jgi:hypothetical protein
VTLKSFSIVLEFYLSLCSRELAVLRVKEAKIKKELEDSKLLAEKWSKENRIKALELRTAALRLKAGKVSNNPLERRSVEGSDGRGRQPSRVQEQVPSSSGALYMQNSNHHSLPVADITKFQKYLEDSEEVRIRYESSSNLGFK